MIKPSQQRAISSCIIDSKVGSYAQCNARIFIRIRNKKKIVVYLFLNRSAPWREKKKTNQKKKKKRRKQYHIATVRARQMHARAVKSFVYYRAVQILCVIREKYKEKNRRVPNSIIILLLARKCFAVLIFSSHAHAPPSQMN